MSFMVKSETSFQRRGLWLPSQINVKHYYNDITTMTDFIVDMQKKKIRKERKKKQILNKTKDKAKTKKKPKD